MTIPTVYPHLQVIMDAIATATGLPVTAFASLAAIPIQHAPAIFVVPEEMTVLETIADRKTITALRFEHVLSVITLLKDAGDQTVGTPLVLALGELQALILNTLGQTRLKPGGPITIIDLPKSESFLGGFVAGRIRFSTQFILTVE